MEKLRQVFMWLTIVSLAVVTASMGLSTFLSRSISSVGWTFYTPYSQPNPLAMNIILACSGIDRIFLPIATGCAAMYIILVERALRRITGAERSRGFEVQPSDR
jgi:heme/copper-type cytochrome/quinol oxidase subunit 1